MAAPHLKLSASALILDGPLEPAIRGDLSDVPRVLLNVFKDGKRSYYNLPGGVTQRGESLHEALRREVREETGLALNSTDIGLPLLLWEYEPKRLNLRFGKRHKVGVVFRCALPTGQQPKLPKKPDPKQIDVRWFPLESLPMLDLQPHVGSLLLDALHARLRVPFYLEG